MKLVRKVLPEVSLDPASEEAANICVKANQFYDASMNGLVLPWKGAGVYVNPPFGKTALGRSMQGSFVRKAYKEYNIGNAGEVLLLIKGALGYRWFSELLKTKSICLLYERIEFVDGDTLLPCKQNPHGSAVLYIGKNTKRFAQVFSKFGKCLNTGI